MANNPNAVKNLHPVKKGEVRNPNGRPPKLVNALKKLPTDMQDKVYGIIGYALTLQDETEAKKYLEAQKGELGQYGFLMQIAIRKLTSPYGWEAVMDIFDRLYGKPRQSAEITHKGGITLNVSTDAETKELIEGGLE